MTIFSKKLNKIANNTNVYLKNFFIKQKKQSSLLKPMKYGIFSGGKRIRSAIVSGAGKIYGIDEKKLIIIGAAIECIHSYSLIHDDLPSMDNDDYRRGKLSVHKKFNEFTAILAGNSLLTLGYEILSGKDLRVNKNCKEQLIKVLSISAGHSGLAGGQYFDLTFDYKKVSKKNIIDMQKNKTGELFGFCCESVGIIKGINLKKRKKLKNIGTNIGLLFQIVDDLIDFNEDNVSKNKLKKNQKKKRKATLINFLGHKKTIDFAINLKKNIDKELKKYGPKSQDLLEVVDFIIKRRI